MNAVSAVTGTRSITYSDDQFDRCANNPPPPIGCNAAANDTSSRDHTNIATGHSNLFQGGAQPYGL